MLNKSTDYTAVKLTEEDKNHEDHECGECAMIAIFTSVSNSPIFNFSTSTKTLIILLLSLLACVYCYLVCLPCTLIIIAFCFLFCICAPVLNIPLWISIMFLLIGGFTWFPDNALQISWGGHH